MKCISCTHILVPTLTVVMQPAAGVAVDIPPYNSFTFRCSANAPDSVLLQKQFEWRSGGRVIRDDGNMILISHRNLNMPQSISELTVNDLTIGIHSYSCNVRMSVPGGPDATAQTPGMVNVKGKVVFYCRKPSV